MDDSLKNYLDKLMVSIPGGSWAESARGCGATSRRRGHPSFCIDDLGFRLAKSIRWRCVS